MLPRMRLLFTVKTWDERASRHTLVNMKLHSQVCRKKKETKIFRSRESRDSLYHASPRGAWGELGLPGMHGVGHAAGRIDTPTRSKNEDLGSCRSLHS